MKYRLLALFFIFASISDVLSQARHIPVTLNSPLFNQDNQAQIGIVINNLGLNHNIATQFKSHLIIASLQQNNGGMNFDPLGFNNYEDLRGDVAQVPKKMFYAEVGFGHNFAINNQLLCIIAGVGQQFENKNRRYFLQFDWGSTGNLINAGLTMRANYNTNRKFILEPMIQAKINIGRLKIVHQFGYSMAITSDVNQIVPLMSIGLQYLLRNNKRSKTMEVDASL